MPGFVTIAMTFASDRIDAVQARLDSWGNPACDALRKKLDKDGTIHFMSGSCFLDGERAFLLLEASSDNSEPETVQRLAAALDGDVRELFVAAGLALEVSSLEATLEEHRLRFGFGWSATPGLMFCGTPGLDVKRIKDEAALAERVEAMVLSGVQDRALATLSRVRAELRREPGADWALQAAPAELLAGTPAFSLIGLAWAGLKGLAADFLWPFILLTFLAAAGLTIAVFFRSDRSIPDALRAVVCGFGLAIVLAVVASALFSFLVYVLLRLAESSDIPDDAAPSAAEGRAIAERENQTAQNHLFAVSTMKPGWFRRLTLRLALFGIGLAAAKAFRPGFLGSLGTIHFARFLMLPKTDKLLFFSNYGGSWQSYLEDFILEAHVGLTAVWSNTIGFPKANNLAFDGATDGDRFKRWARRQQLPTRFWYSAYPELTTARIRTNAAIRQGLASIACESDARDWLSLFGSQPAGPSEIDKASVQTLALGGLGRVPFAGFLVGKLPQDLVAARNWLSNLSGRLSFDATRTPDLAINVAFTATGLDRLGLTPSQLATFPVAFQDGMTAPWRSRALGDVEQNAPSGWHWGAAGDAVDFAVLVYAMTSDGLDAAIGIERRVLAECGGVIVAHIATPPLPPPEQSSPEPFGFEDGISQPKIRGLRATTVADRDHVVEPGELLLGYPDNSGFMPPTPFVAAIDDPENLLSGFPAGPSAQKPDFAAQQPNAARDLGRGGTYLVIRQLEQNVQGFWAAVERAAESVRDSAPVRSGDVADWVAAKTIGRWRNGDPLTLHPYKRRFEAATDENDFRFSSLDPSGIHCPFGSHIRRANPRDSIGPDPQSALAVSNRHRILRIGRPYQPKHESDNPGLFFMCLNADIERQFEFLQQNWIGNPQFAGLRAESDPVLGIGPAATGRLSIPTTSRPLCVLGFKDFVRVLGGGYFFLPSLQALRFLSAPAQTTSDTRGGGLQGREFA